MIDKGQKVLIVGLGLIGGSYAQGLVKAGFEVGAITRSQKTIDFALSKGMISHGTIEVNEDYVSKFDIIVFAVYPHVFIEWIEKYQNFIKEGAIITDVTGVKSPIVYKIQGMLRKDLEFVGVHPMAGKAVSGIENADCSVFKDANYILTPTSLNTERALAICEDIGRILGFSKISRISPERHDDMIGFLSQLAHCIAVSLMNCNDSPDLVKFTGDSFRDLTRIANINYAMWPELFILNKDRLLNHIDKFMQQLNILREAIQDDNIEKMEELMKESTKRRKNFDK